MLNWDYCKASRRSCRECYAPDYHLVIFLTLFQGSKTKRVLVLGLNRAGKTQLIRAFQPNSVPGELLPVLDPTRGWNIKTVKLGKYGLRIWDGRFSCFHKQLSRNLRKRPFWHPRSLVSLPCPHGETLLILSPETDNCPSWIIGREIMTIENISWSISMNEYFRTRWGSNPRPPDQSDAHLTGDLYCIYPKFSHRQACANHVVPDQRGCIQSKHRPDLLWTDSVQTFVRPDNAFISDLGPGLQSFLRVKIALSIRSEN